MTAEEIFHQFLKERPEMLGRIRYRHFPDEDEPEPVLDARDSLELLSWLEGRGLVPPERQEVVARMRMTFMAMR